MWSGVKPSGSMGGLGAGVGRHGAVLVLIPAEVVVQAVTHGAETTDLGMAGLAVLQVVLDLEDRLAQQPAAMIVEATAPPAEQAVRLVDQGSEVRTDGGQSGADPLAEARGRSRRCDSAR